MADKNFAKYLFDDTDVRDICSMKGWSDKNAIGQLFQKVENDENRFFAITSSKLVTN